MHFCASVKDERSGPARLTASCRLFEVVCQPVPLNFIAQGLNMAGAGHNP